MSSIAQKIAKRRKIQVSINDTIQGGTINNIIGDNVQFSNNDSYEKPKNETEDRKGGDETKKKINIWKDWINFLEHHKPAFRPYSPEANNIIRAGNSISAKAYWNRNLYTRHLEDHAVQSFTIPDVFQKHINTVVDCSSLSQFKKNISGFSTLIELLEEDKVKEMNLLKFLEELFTELYETYTSPIEKGQSEDAFNQVYIWPYLTVVGKTITLRNSRGGFQNGQPRLEGMTKQLKANGIFVDEKSCYKTDGFILIVETSGHFGNTDRVKLKFDHYKGMFVLLAMLKCTADEFYYGSVQKFSEVKVFFLNGADEELHLWSVSFKEEKIFDLWREATLHIKPDFDNMDEFLPESVQFFWTIKGLLEQSAVNMICAKEEHQNILKINQYIYTTWRNFQN